MKHASGSTRNTRTTRTTVEVAHLVNGKVVSVRRLSSLGEWRAALSSGGVVLGLAMGAALLVAVGLLSAGRVVYAPAYVALWVGVGVAAAAVAGNRARARARRYVVGAGIDDDAFSATPFALVNRVHGTYHLTVTPGMTGRVDSGPSPVLLESLVRDKPVLLPLATDAQVEACIETTTFVIGVRAEEARAAALPRGFTRRLTRRALVPLELAALASVLLATPAGAQLCEADMKSAIPKDATPWEIEKLLRSEAQSQARSLHRCFDVLPLECQHPGYVAVGLSLSREGEIRGQWIARSTFGQDCPVDQCMSDVISTWFFEPLPESMRVVLPVQVLRTDRPMPTGLARAAENAARRQAARNEVN